MFSEILIILSFLLLFNYSCPHFSPIVLHCPSQTFSHIQSSPPLSLSMGPLYMLLDLTFPIILAWYAFPHVLPISVIFIHTYWPETLESSFTPPSLSQFSHFRRDTLKDLLYLCPIFTPLKLLYFIFVSFSHKSLQVQPLWFLWLLIYYLFKLSITDYFFPIINEIMPFYIFKKCNSVLYFAKLSKNLM